LFKDDFTFKSKGIAFATSNIREEQNKRDGMNNMYMNCNQEYYCRNAMDEYELDDMDDYNLDDNKWELDIYDPIISIHGPKIGPKIGVGLDIHGPKIGGPSLDIHGPKIRLPNVDIDIIAPKIGGGLDIHRPKIGGPSLDIHGPKIRLPNDDIDINALE